MKQLHPIPEDEEAIRALTDLPSAVTMLKTYSHDDPSLIIAMKEVIWGINHQFHYGYYYEQRYKDEKKKGVVRITTLTLTLEQLWEEMTDRLALAKKLLLERIREDDTSGDR